MRERRCRVLGVVAERGDERAVHLGLGVFRRGNREGSPVDEYV